MLSSACPSLGGDGLHPPTPPHPCFRPRRPPSPCGLRSGLRPLRRQSKPEGAPGGRATEDRCLAPRDPPHDAE